MVYFDKFQDEGSKRGVLVGLSVDLEFADLEGQNGRCDYGKRILIDRGSWDMESEVNREVVMFHEMGHCILNRRNHTDILLDNGQPSSIMDGRYRPQYAYVENREYYLDELFQASAH